VNPFSAADAPDRPLRQNQVRLRRLAVTGGTLLLLYGVLAVIAALGGPRIGAPVLPLPGGGPDPASPVAGLQPVRPTQSVPAIPHGTTSATPTPGVTPENGTPLPPATTSAVTVAGPVDQATPCPTPTPGESTPQLAEEYDPTVPVTTRTPPSRPAATTTDPEQPSTSRPTGDPTTPPQSTPPPTDPSTPPDSPLPPGHDQSLRGILGALLGKLGL